MTSKRGSSSGPRSAPQMSDRKLNSSPGAVFKNEQISAMCSRGTTTVTSPNASTTSPTHAGFACCNAVTSGDGVTLFDGVPAGFEYWSLAKKGGKLGYVASPVGGRNGLDPAEFTTVAARNFIGAAEKWLTGEEPFTAKLHPEYAPYGEYDQLMRLDEWYGREG